MKNNIKNHLEEILHTGNIQKIRNEIKIILAKEILAIEAPIDEKNKFIEVIELFDLPLKISNHVVYKRENDRNLKRNIPMIAAALSGVALNILFRRLPLIPSAILSVGGAALTGYLVNTKMVETHTPLAVSLEQSIDTPISDIVDQIDKVTNIVKLLLKPSKNLLNESYPNIIKWYQETYASCDEFDKECSDYFKKRIVKILEQCCLTVHDYDGTNSQLFTKDKNVNIHEVIQNLPAITNDKGYILLGSLSIPTNYKI